jgi:hypothetical protein
MITIAARRIALLVALVAPLAATAQTPGGGRGPSRRGPMFDATTVKTVQGEIVEVQRLERRRGDGVHLVLDTGAEKLDVHLGPAFYVDAREPKLAKGDRVEVKGSRVTMGGAPALIAQEVRRGEQVLALRDAYGKPLWSGPQGRRP